MLKIMEEFFITVLKYTILICGSLYILIPFFVQSRIYYPSKQHFLVNLNYEDIYINTPDGLKINAWYIPPSEKNITVIFCHGNGGNLSFYEEKLTLLYQKGYGVLAIDYRGYGKSEGKPHEQGLYTDLRSAVDYLKKEKNIYEEDIVLWGLSLGGAVVAQIASENHKFKGVILQSTFTSIQAMASDVIHKAYLGIKSDHKNFVTHKLLKLVPTIQKFDTKSKIKDIKSPLLISHALPDNIVPAYMSKELGAINPNAQIYISKDGGHNEHSWFYPRLFTFLESLEKMPNKNYYNALKKKLGNE